MTEREQVEYSALRATIRERGTARVYIFAGGVAAWGALAIATAAVAATPIATLLPLLVLACVFEAVFALHVGVERVGRYLQVFHEVDGDAKWEHAAMAFGRPRGAAAADALFTLPFLIAALFNVGPALVVEPTRAELVFIGGAHALFIVRLAAAREAARRQRAIDLARFTELRRAPGA
jgi:hypothetical protein